MKLSKLDDFRCWQQKEFEEKYPIETKGDIDFREDYFDLYCDIVTYDADEEEGTND